MHTAISKYLHRSQRDFLPNSAMKVLVGAFDSSSSCRCRRHGRPASLVCCDCRRLGEASSASNLLGRCKTNAGLCKGSRSTNCSNTVLVGQDQRQRQRSGRTSCCVVLVRARVLRIRWLQIVVPSGQLRGQQKAKGLDLDV
jgi:hypothetical protein